MVVVKACSSACAFLLVALRNHVDLCFISKHFRISLYILVVKEACLKIK